MRRRPSAGSNGFLLRCCSYCAAVPCPTFSAFLLHAVSLSACCGSLLVGVYRTRDVIKQPTAFPLVLPITLGSLFGMLLVAVLVLFVATVSSRALSDRLVNASINTSLVRFASIVIITLLVVLQCCWLFIAVALGAVVLLLQHFYLVQLHNGCIRFINYGLPITPSAPSWYCYEAMKEFYIEIQNHDLFLCYSISFVSAVVVFVSLTFLTISTTINIVRLERSHRKMSDVKSGGNVSTRGMHIKSSNIDDEITPVEL